MRSSYARRPVSALLALAMCALANPAMRADNRPAAPAAPLVIPSGAATTPEAIEQRLQGKTLFLRGFYLDDHLEFDTGGKVEGNPAKGSFTLSGIEVKKVHFTKHSVEIEGDRIGLHFFGALPYEDDSKPYESIKVSGKPVQISIERLVIEPEKKKKNKEKDKGKDKDKKHPETMVAKAGVPNAAPAATQDAAERTGVGLSENDAANAPTAVQGDAPSSPGTSAAAEPVHRDPRESYVVLSAALDKVFAPSLDQSVIETLPVCWQTYFATKAGRARTATDAAALHPGGDVKAPHLLAMISPDSNDYAQKSGIAGMILLQTIVDPAGKPGQITIVRPIGFGLDEKAVEAVERSKFRPGTQGGKAVPVLVNLEVTFRIYSDRTRETAPPAQVAPKGEPTPAPRRDGPPTVAAATLKQ